MPKFKCYIVTLPLSCRQDQGGTIRSVSHKVFGMLEAKVSMIARYFACYGTPANFDLKVHFRTDVTPARIRRAVRTVAKRVRSHPFGRAGAMFKLEERGEISLLHSMMTDAALSTASADTQQIADAFHWFLNMAGCTYADEIMLTSGMAFTAGRAIHPSPEIAPLPWGFTNKSP